MVKETSLLCGSLALLRKVSALLIRIKPSSESKGGECHRGYDLALSFAVTFLVLTPQSPFQTALEPTDLGSEVCCFLNKHILSHTGFCLLSSNLRGR